MIQYLSNYLKHMLSTPGPIMSTPAHQPVPGGGARRDHNAGKVRHDRSARRARAGVRIASAPPCALRDAYRNGMRGSPRLHAREIQQHVKVSSSGQEPVDGNHVIDIAAPSTHLRRRGHEPSRQRVGGAQSSISIAAWRANNRSAAKPTHLCPAPTPHMRVRREVAQRSDPRR